MVILVLTLLKMAFLVCPQVIDEHVDVVALLVGQYLPDEELCRVESGSADFPS